MVALWTVVEVQDSAFAKGGLKEGCAKQEIYMSSSGRGINWELLMHINIAGDKVGMFP